MSLTDIEQKAIHAFRFLRYQCHQRNSSGATDSKTLGLYPGHVINEHGVALNSGAFIAEAEASLRLIASLLSNSAPTRGSQRFPHAKLPPFS